MVDDGSRDRTAEVLRRCAEGNPKILAHGFARNRGKGAAVAEGVRHARGKVILFVDADLSYGTGGLLACAGPALAGDPIVIGSKRARGSMAEVRPSPARRAASAVYRAFVRILLRLPASDTQCGLKAFSRGSAERIFALRTIDGFAFDVELLVIARRSGIEVREIPVTWSYGPGSSVRPFGSGLRAVWDLARIWWRDVTGGYRTPPSSGPG